MGRTCYMNSTVQCLSATYPFSQLFLGQLSHLEMRRFKLTIRWELQKGDQHAQQAWYERKSSKRLV
jgi:ubiquitin C-terminal hydrolase